MTGSESDCPDCGTPGQEIDRKPLPGKRMGGLIEIVFTCSSVFCPRSRTTWSVIEAREV